MSAYRDKNRGQSLIYLRDRTRVSLASIEWEREGGCLVTVTSVRGIQSPRSGRTEREAVSFSTNVNEEIYIYEGNSVSTIRRNRERGSVALHQRQRGDRRLREERSSSSVRGTQSPRSGGTERERQCRSPPTSTRRPTSTEGVIEFISQEYSVATIRGNRERGSIAFSTG